MKLNRIITLAVLAGVTLLAVTFLTAAKTSTTDAKATQDPAKAQGTGVVVFANVDVEAGLIPIFPETFPQPAKVVQVFVKEGGFIKKDDPLVELDSQLAKWTLEEAQVGLMTAEAALAGAKAMLDQAKMLRKGQAVAMDAQEFAIKSKKQSLEAARTKLDGERLRAQQQGIKNDPEIKAAEYSLKAAQTDVEFEEKKLEGLRRVSALPNINAAQSKVDEATSAVKRQTILLEKAKYGVARDDGEGSLRWQDLTQ